jgi:hypothetical protein
LAASDEDTNVPASGPRSRMGHLPHAVDRQTRLWRWAKEVAAARELTPSFVKMLLMWRPTVLALR